MQFLDVRTDPYEQRNLAPTGEQADVAHELHAFLTDWNARTTWLDAPPYECKEPWKAREFTPRLGASPRVRS